MMKSLLLLKLLKKTAYADSQEITNVLCNLMQEFCENQYDCNHCPFNQDNICRGSTYKAAKKLLLLQDKTIQIEIKTALLDHEIQSILEEELNKYSIDIERIKIE